MSINGSGSTFIPFTLSGLTSITASNSNIGDATATSLTMTTATPNKIARFNGSQQLVSSTVDVSDLAVLGATNTFSTGFTNNLNGAIRTVNNPLAINNAGINAETISAIVPSTYTLVSGFYRFVSPSSLTGSMQFPSAFTYGTTPLQKYILTLTNCSTNGTDPVLATVYNATTGLIISDATQTITSTAETITLTFMTGTSPSIIYLEFSAGAINYFVQWSALSVQQCNTEVLSNLVLDAPIISNMTQSPGTTTNLAGGLLVSQTSTGVSASTFTQTGMPASAPASTLTFSSPTYTLTSTGAFATWLGAGTTYITGAKYTFNFGSMFGSQALQLQVVQYNVAGSARVDIGDIPYSVSKTSSTISGSFTAGLNASYLGSIVFFFTPTGFSQNVKFDTFTMTRADTQMTGVTTLPTNAGTAVAGIGLNASNQIVTTAVPTNFSAVTVGYVPYESATDTFSNSLISQGLTNLGYTGASFTASTGIGSITFASPTYTANSSASYQGIITLPALPSTIIGTPCIATITASAFPFFAVAPYPYFTLTNGATVVYTSPTGSPGTVSMPFTPTSTTLFMTLYFKAPPTPQTAGIFTWTNFTITTATPSIAITTAGGTLTVLSNGSTTHVSGDNSYAKYGPSASYPGYYLAVGATPDVGSASIGQLIITDGNVFLDAANNKSIYYGNYQTDRGGQGIHTFYGNVYTANNLNVISGSVGIGTAGVPSHKLQVVGDVSANGLIVNGGGTYTEGCIYTDSNWGMLLRAKVVGAVAAFDFRNSVGTRMMSITNAGVMTHTMGDSSYMRYGPNATWNSYLTVGATPDRSGANNAQVITTNGNLHMDAGNSNAMFYGYYANARGTPNSHEFYGTSVNFQSGLPQNGNASFTSQVAVFDGVALKKSQAVNKLVYFNNNVAWGGGVNMTYAFYLYNTACSVQFWGKNSGYYSGAGMMQTMIRVYSQVQGTYQYYPINAFVNVGYNHFTVPLNYAANFGATGWYDIYVYSTSGWITDGNDQLTIGVTILPANGF